MSKQLRELQARKTTLVKEARALTDQAAAEGRDLTDDEGHTAFEGYKTRIEALNAALKIRPVIASIDPVNGMPLAILYAGDEKIGLTTGQNTLTFSSVTASVLKDVTYALGFITDTSFAFNTFSVYATPIPWPPSIRSVIPLLPPSQAHCPPVPPSPTTNSTSAIPIR